MSQQDDIATISEQSLPAISSCNNDNNLTKDITGTLTEYQSSLLEFVPSTSPVEIRARTRLFCSDGEGSSLKSIVLKSAFTYCTFVTQKPTCTSKSKDHFIMY